MTCPRRPGRPRRRCSRWRGCRSWRRRAGLGAVVDDQPVAVDAAPVGRHDPAGGGGAQRGAAAAAEVDAVVQAPVVVDRVGAVAERRGDVAVDGVGSRTRVGPPACERAWARARREPRRAARLRSISSILLLLLLELAELGERPCARALRASPRASRRSPTSATTESLAACCSDSSACISTRWSAAARRWAATSSRASETCCSGPRAAPRRPSARRTPWPPARRSRRVRRRGG